MASVFWGGDLFAVKYFALGERVVFDDVPMTASVEVRTRVVEAEPKMPRNGWDLPLGAIALTAACMNVMVVGSLVHDGPKYGAGNIQPIVHTVAGEPLVDSNERATSSSLASLRRALPEAGAPSEPSGDTKAPIDVLGDTGMIDMLARYRGDAALSVRWAPEARGPGVMWGDRVGDTWSVAGLGLSGTGEGGGGRNALGNYVLDRVHTVGTGEGFGAAHGHLAGHHAGIVCHLPVTTAISCTRIAPEIIQRVVRASLPRFRACYEDGLRKNPSLAGRVVTKFVIARDGNVATASDGGSDLADDDVRACVQRAFTTLEFPANPDGVGTVTYPIVMSPAE